MKAKAPTLPVPAAHVDERHTIAHRPVMINLLEVCRPTVEPGYKGFIAFHDGLRVVAAGETIAAATGCYWASLITLIEYARDQGVAIEVLAGTVPAEAIALIAPLAICAHRS